MKFLLDSNALVCALNDTGGVRGRLNDAQSSGATILTSAVVVGELAFGASASARPEQNHARLRAMLAKMEVVPFTGAAARKFGDIAVVEDATLVTDDRALLDASIPGLGTEDWTRRGAGP